MNNLWIGMILLGIVYGAVTGNMQAVTDAVFASAKEAVTLCITMTGMMALWVGVMEIARGAGLIRKWSEKLKPFIHFLFPGIPKGHKVQEYIAANMIANILGLGSAATPAGLKAMEELAEKSARLAELNAQLDVDEKNHEPEQDEEEQEDSPRRPSVLAALEEKSDKPEPVKPFRSYYDKDGDAR